MPFANRKQRPCILPIALFFGLVAGFDLPAIAQSAPAGVPSFGLGVGDVLTISVWKNPDLSVTVPIGPDGKIALPLVGEIEVLGQSPETVRIELTEEYKRFVTAPTVSVVVKEINSRRVFVVGEVKLSGAYDLLQPTTLMQVLAMAGGLTEYAKKDQIVVLRQVGPEQQRFVLSIKDITTGKSTKDNIYLEPGDTIVVP